MAPSTLRRLVRQGTGMLAAVAIATASGVAADATCSTVGSTVYLTDVPEQVSCVTLYSQQWKYIATKEVQVNGGILQLEAGDADVRHAEFYDSPDCAPQSFINVDLECLASREIPSLPTDEPTGEPTDIPTEPATKPPTTQPPTTLPPTTQPPTTLPPTTQPPTTLPPTTQPPAANATEIPSVPDPVNATAVPTAPAPVNATSAPTTVPSTPADQYLGAPPSSLIRSMYVWELNDCLFNVVAPASYVSVCGASNYREVQDDLITRLRNPWNIFAPYNRIFLQVRMTTLRQQAAAVREFLAKATANGITVEYLEGEALWVTSDANMDVPIQACADIAAFNRESSSPGQRFAGVHLDIEPHTLGASWRENANPGPGKDRYNDDYQRRLVTIFRRCKSILAGTGATLAWDAGADYYAYVTDTWNELVANPFLDYVTLMNYFDNEEEFIHGSREEKVGGVDKILASLKGVIPAVFALETIMPPHCPPQFSLWKNGTLAAENMLTSIGRLYDGSRGFAGLATHHHGSYAILSPYGPPPEPTCEAAGTRLTVDPISDQYRCIVVYQVVNEQWLYITDRVINGNTPVTLDLSVSGPYSIELYDSPTCERATPASTIGSAEC
jgi:hypothetical protein